MKDIFTSHYQNNFWSDDESVSGHGSTLAATETIRQVLPKLFKVLDIKTLVDVPCGDFNWFREIWADVEWQLDRYIGMDVVQDLIYQNRERYNHPKLEFQTMDITRDRLPPADLILVRDLFGHFSNADVKKALVNIRSSGAKYLLATTYPGRKTTGDIQTGEWRPIDLDYLWGFPPALEYINENCTEGGGAFADKCLGLWKLQEDY